MGPWVNGPMGQWGPRAHRPEGQASRRADRPGGWGRAGRLGRPRAGRAGQGLTFHGAMISVPECQGKNLYTI
jgi:hypothetical protein